MDIFRTELRPSYNVSRIIKGNWQLSDDHLRHGSLDRQQAIRDMRSFVEAGINTFDVADIYTGAEELIGDFLREYDQRDAVNVHTKYVPDLAKLETVTLAGTQEIIDRSLTRLGVERLDLVQFHWWNYAVPRYVDVALHLKELQQQGKIRHIGVTNFDASHLQELLDAGIDVVSAQVQYSVLDRRPAKGFDKFCAQNGIAMLCYGSLAGGFLGEKYRGEPDTFTDLMGLENRSLTKYRLIIDEVGGWGSFQQLLQLLHGVGEKHGISLSEVAVAYVLAQPGVGACIVGAHNAKHLQRLQSLKTLKLEPDDVAAIGQFLQGMGTVPGDMYELERSADTHKGVMKYNLNTAPH